ncbi:MAG TPA: hypothetical protein VK157_08085 [Phycisphaerales bacterium]|nr:hypothetical protein [Phycisphaerales bacterium]
MPESLPNKPQQPKPASPRQSGELGIDPVMAELVKTSAQSTAKACPQCKSFLPQNAAICTTCGYNLQTGKTVATRVSAAPREKAAKPASAVSNFENPLAKDTPWVMFAIYFVLGLAPGLLAMNESTQTLAAIATGVSFLAGIALMIFVLVVAFRESVAQGVVLLLCGLTFILFIPLLYILYYVLFKTEDVRVKGAYGGGLLAGVISLAISWGAVQEQINKQRNAPGATPPAAVGAP